ncbi:MAG: vWA domain-containing protein [Actinomycetota bacterium]|nr:vWA domain-containing protein [Actinomycetota bacterium]
MGRDGRHRRRATDQTGPSAGKSPDPLGGDDDLNKVSEGDEAQQELTEQARRTSSRRQLGAAHDRFEEVSPEVGVIDEDAFDALMSDDPDEALALLADATGATDPKLRELARRLAGRLVIDLARSGIAQSRGVGRLVDVPADRSPADLDLDASLEALQMARAAGRPAGLDELRSRAWARPDTAICLVVDRSGSMGGDRLATAAIAAAATVWRVPEDHSLVAFSERAMVLASQGRHHAADALVADVLRLRGHGPTDLALALRTARAQLERSRARRKLTILLSDCRHTTGDEPLAAAGALDELAIVAPADDTADAEHLARAVGARWVPVEGPSAIPAAFSLLFGQ